MGILEVVSSNPSTGYYMDDLFVVKLFCHLKTKKNQKFGSMLRRIFDLQF